MKAEAKLLFEKSIASLTLAIELFNRPSELGRKDATLILLDHANEMFLKAAIVEKGGKLRDSKDENTHGFDKCVRIGLSDGGLQFLSEEQALTLQAVNGLRDAAQHHLVVVSEMLLYVHAQGTLTLVGDLAKSVFNVDLRERLPSRVLPVSTTAPTDLFTLFETELHEVAKLLAPGRRKRTEAKARLKPLAILSSTLQGSRTQPTARDLEELGQRVVAGESWEEIFPGIAGIGFTADGSGIDFALRITKREGVPTTLVPEGTPGAFVIGVRRVNELDFYNLSHTSLHQKLGITPNKLTALIQVHGIQDDPEFFKKLTIGGSVHKRYSPKALTELKSLVRTVDLESVWRKYREGVKARRP